MTFWVKKCFILFVLTFPQFQWMSLALSIFQRSLHQDTNETMEGRITTFEIHHLWVPCAKSPKTYTEYAESPVFNDWEPSNF